MTLDEIQNAVIQGKPRLAEKLVEEALENGADSAEILARGLLGGMQQIGLRFGDDRDVARALASSRAMKAGLEKLKPFLEQGVMNTRGKILIGTAGGDVHDVGKNIVGYTLRYSGFQVVDLGVDVSAEQFVQAVRDNLDAGIVCISSLLTTSMPEMRHIVQALNGLEQRGRFKIMIGGGSVTREFAREIGADAYTENAMEAARFAVAAVEEQQK